MAVGIEQSDSGPAVARAELCTDDRLDRKVICLEIGDYRMVGSFDPQAFIHMDQHCARELADQLNKVANELERFNK